MSDAGADAARPTQPARVGRVGLLTVHGMGDAPADYHATLMQSLAPALGDDWARVAVLPVYYQHLLKPNEAEVWTRMRQTGRMHYPDLRKFLLFGLSDAAGLENRKDDPGSVYEQAQQAIATQLLLAREQLGEEGRIVALAQSLGGQVLSSFLYDAQKALKARRGVARVAFPTAGVFSPDALAQRPHWDEATLRWLAGAGLVALHTTGCNIPVFVAAHPRMRVLPIDPPRPGFRWVNHYDPDDVLGWPLQPLGNGYERLVEDRPINSGRGLIDWLMKSWNPWSHTTYWTDREVTGAIAADLQQALATPG